MSTHTVYVCTYHHVDIDQCTDWTYTTPYMYVPHVHIDQCTDWTCTRPHIRTYHHVDIDQCGPVHGPIYVRTTMWILTNVLTEPTRPHICTYHHVDIDQCTDWSCTRPHICTTYPKCIHVAVLRTLVCATLVWWWFKSYYKGIWTRMSLSTNLATHMCTWVSVTRTYGIYQIQMFTK